MRGYLFQITKSPRAVDITSKPGTIIIPAGTSRTIEFANEVWGICSGFQVINRDGANTITITINNDTVNAFTIPASAAFGANDQWIEQLTIAAGAAGVSVLNFQYTPLNELGLAYNRDDDINGI
jgi:hypothetical protein